MNNKTNQSLLYWNGETWTATPPGDRKMGTKYSILKVTKSGVRELIVHGNDGFESLHNTWSPATYKGYMSTPELYVTLPVNMSKKGQVIAKGKALESIERHEDHTDAHKFILESVGKLNILAENKISDEPNAWVSAEL